MEAYWTYICWLAVAVACGLAIAAVRGASPARVGLAGLLLCTGLVHGAYAVALTSGKIWLFPLQVAFAACILQAAFLVSFTAALLARLQRERPSTAAAGYPVLAGVGLAALVFVPEGLVERDYFGVPFVTVGLWGQTACAGLLLLLLLGISGLERLLRRVRDPLRYQLKFLLLGFGVLPVICVYVASVFLLEGIWRPQLAIAHSSVTLLGLALAGVGLRRLNRVSEWHARTIAEETGGSLSLAIAGAFLLAMGAAGALLPNRVATSRFVFEVTVASATGVALAVALASRYVRTSLQRFVARSLKRSKYDYRQKWLQVIDAFHGVTSVDAILDCLVDLLGRSFSAGRISVWMQSDADRKFHQSRSVNVEAPPAPLASTHPLVVTATSGPDVIRNGDQVVLDDDFVQATHARLVAPLWGGTLLGFVVLGEVLGGGDYDQDDEDLLQAISHHAGLLLAHAQLAERHRAASETRALHELSLFCMHDLKNLAGRLSLVAQNARRFGDNPEFQSSALRTVATTVERMTQLIQKLSAGATPECVSDLDSGPTDLFDVLAGATETIREGIRLRMPPPEDPGILVKMGREALHNVLLNVVTNAEQALDGEGEIAMEIERADGHCTVTVRDDGPGIEPEVLAKIFEPFRGTKQSGLGIGLYQCRRTVEAAGGSIVVDSQPGVGTQVKFDLPLAVASEKSA